MNQIQQQLNYELGNKQLLNKQTNKFLANDE